MFACTKIRVAMFGVAAAVGAAVFLSGALPEQAWAAGNAASGIDGPGNEASEGAPAPGLQSPGANPDGAGSQTDPNYVIGPGDTIQVFVWREPELSVTVPVRPDGKISTPLVEDMVAVGRTSSQLARAIEKVLAEYIRSPQVNIIITNPVSTFSHVKVIGEVASPQSVPYREGLTALDVVLAVGGLTQFAAGNRAKVIRKDENGKDVEIKIRLEALLRKGRISENLALRPGDVLIVPESFF